MNEFQMLYVRFKAVKIIMPFYVGLCRLDVTVLTCAWTGYCYVHVVSSMGYCFGIPLSRSFLCVSQSYGPNVVVLHSSVPVRLYYLPVWGLNWCFRNVSRCITYRLQVACTHKWLSVQHVELQESARCEYRMCRFWVTNSTDAATARDHWSRCIYRLLLQCPLPLSLIPFRSSGSQWMRNDRTGFLIMARGRLVFKTGERSGSASHAGYGAGHTATQWVWLWDSSGSDYAMTACTQSGGWMIHCPMLCGGGGWKSRIEWYPQRKNCSVKMSRWSSDLAF